MDGSSISWTSRPVASRGRSIGLCLIVIVLAVAGFMTRHDGTGAASPSRHPGENVTLLLSLLGGECLMFRFVLASLRGVALPLRSLVSARRIDRWTFIVDLAIGVLLFLLWRCVEWGLTRLLGPGDVQAVGRLGLAANWEIPLWLLLSACAGLVEELVFRGIVQQQASYLTGRTSIGVIVQAALFGAGHLYQGAADATQIAIFGLVFGAVAATRKSLIPGMLAHSFEDVLAGLSSLN